MYGGAEGCCCCCWLSGEVIELGPAGRPDDVGRARTNPERLLRMPTSGDGRLPFLRAAALRLPRGARRRAAGATGWRVALCAGAMRGRDEGAETAVELEQSENRKSPPTHGRPGYPRLWWLRFFLHPSFGLFLFDATARIEVMMGSERGNLMQHTYQGLVAGAWFKESLHKKLFPDPGPARPARQGPKRKHALRPRSVRDERNKSTCAARRKRGRKLRAEARQRHRDRVEARNEIPAPDHPRRK